MDSFDINRLTDFDFEEVCKDIFETQLGIPLEIFTPGRDNGIDLRFIAPGAKEAIIIQCKHWPHSTSAKLIRHLQKVELPKLISLKPGRYLLATSARLTPSAKDQIKEALSPFIKSSGDVYGLQEISNLLKGHPEIVRRHVRLWLSSTAVLQSLLNKRLLTRSSDLIQEIERTALTYVPNPSHERASRILERQHVCIVSGIPGIGKTTLAKILACEYADQGYEIYEISEDADEINSAWDDDVLQFFFYDDFLGQTTLDDKLHKNEDSRLLRILRRVSQSPNKRLVLTTREYIMEQAKQRYERIDSAEFNPLTCILAISDYTKLIRGEILYNHIYFSGLSPEDKACFARPETYKAIIGSAKFNPRLIDASIRVSTDRGLDGNEVAQEILNNLISPHRLWEHIVQNQLADLQIQILVTLFSLPPKVPYDALVRALRARVNSAFSDYELEKSMKVLERTMTQSTSPREDEIVIGFHNPSIRDYMREFVFRAPATLWSLLATCTYFEQVEQLWPYLSRWGDGIKIFKNTEIKEQVVSAVVGTFDRPGISQDLAAPPSGDELFRRSGIALNVSQLANSREIRNLVYQWLRDVDLYSCMPNTDDVLAVVKAMIHPSMESIKIPNLMRMDEFIEYITEDTNSWECARFAQFALEEIFSAARPLLKYEAIMNVLAHSVNREVNYGELTLPQFFSIIRRKVDQVDLRVEEEVKEAIRQVDTTGEIPVWMNGDIDEIIDYAGDFADTEMLFPGYLNAKVILAQRNAGLASSDKYLPPVSDVNTPDDDAVIDHMFSTFTGLTN